MLPSDVRTAARALYAFCRVADDEIDEGADPGDALQQLTVRLGAAYAGRPFDDPVDRTFSWVVGEYAIPRAIPAALLEGFAWDAAGRRYETLEDLKAYAARVAGTVGVMMALAMGERRSEALARACDLGIAMQLTNIARDVGEDARNGRCYLPLQWLRDFGLNEGHLGSDGVADKRVRRLTRRLLAEADALYLSGFVGIGYLRSDCRAAIRSAGLIYAGIGDQIARNGFDSVTKRAFVPLFGKLALIVRALSAQAISGSVAGAPDRASAFLIEAVAAHPVRRPVAVAGETGWPWVIDLFLDLETRRRQPYSRRAS